MADPTATDGDFHVNASSTPIDLAPYPGAGAEDRVERLMPGRCVAAARHAVVGRRLWLETGAGYPGPAATLDGPAWCWCAAVPNAPRGTFIAALVVKPQESASGLGACSVSRCL